MRAIKRGRVKKSSDYPRFEVRFRDNEELNIVTNTVEDISNRLNQGIKDGEKRFTKKEVVMMLLEEGAKVIKRANLRRG